MIINREYIYDYVVQFRRAIDNARDESILLREFPSFPRGCCGDTCYLLAEFLRMNEIETIYVEGKEGDQSHAWLVVKEDRVLSPTPYTTYLPEDIRVVLSGYSGMQCESSIINAN